MLRQVHNTHLPARHDSTLVFDNGQSPPELPDNIRSWFKSVSSPERRANEPTRLQGIFHPLFRPGEESHELTFEA